ncbi:MAG: hypothetical protein KZQ95_14650 [Candidatus Thiodiazotropha sp. (ex Epidulcina cf. delphinae)]|nr:hypothetical protein [Candidatus Thiodiazotropha sp. (ex Epidulcina cf. delphinae)]
MNDPLFNRLDLFAGFDSGRAGKAAHAPASRLLAAKIGIGSGEGFLFHITDYKTFSSIKP